MKIKKHIAIVVGTRPELIRFASLIHQLMKIDGIKMSLIHTGQHYSDNMNDVFFRELGLPKPNINLAVGKLEPNEQMAKIIANMGQTISEIKPDVVCVWGDTNSSLGVAIAANKKKIKLCHIEAGCRSRDFRMAEEYNRVLIDHLSDLLFPLSKNDQNNLKLERVHGKALFLGDPLYDVFLENQNKISKNGGKKLSKDQQQILLTLHRAENVDNERILKNILTAIGKIKDKKVIFPIHPRTKKMIEKFGLMGLIKKRSIELVEPLGYLELLEALNQSELVITDSGGLQKEAFFARKVCVTLRKSTEWLDTVKLKVNILLDPETLAINKLPKICQDADKYNNLFKKIKKKPYGDGKATEKIVKAIIKEI